MPSMEVKGADGKHVGTVLGIERGRLKLASGGMEHDIDLAMVDVVENDAVRLRDTAEQGGTDLALSRLFQLPTG